MYIYKKEYDLPDIDIIKSDKEFEYKIWQPQKTYIVLGKSDTIENSIVKHKNNDINKKIYVLKRPSGGHSVVLTKNTLVVAVMIKNKDIGAKQFFKKVNSLIIKAIKILNISNLTENGVSDISIGNKKILGSSMYKNKDYLFYHAVLNFAENPEFISKLLKHPKSEPKYRKNRLHIDFLTNIKKHNSKLNIDMLKEKLNTVFELELAYF